MAARLKGLRAVCVMSAVIVSISALSLETPVTPAKLQWQTTSDSSRTLCIALLTETEDAMQSAQARWPVALAMEDLLVSIGGSAVIACLPFATGKECKTFGLRRYERRDEGTPWTLGSATSVASCRAAAVALADRQGFDAVGLRCAELSIDFVRSSDGALRLSGYPSEAVATNVDADETAASLGLRSGDVAYAAVTPSKTLLVELDDPDALAAATAPTDSDYAGAKRILLTAPKAPDDTFTCRSLTFDDDGADDGLSSVVAALGLYWTARLERDMSRPIVLEYQSRHEYRLELALTPPPQPKFGGRKRKQIARLPSVSVAFLGPTGDS